MTQKQAATCFFGLATILILEVTAAAFLLIERAAFINKYMFTQPAATTPEILELWQIIGSLRNALNFLFGVHVLTCTALLYVSFLLLRQFRSRTT